MSSIKKILLHSLLAEFFHVVQSTSDLVTVNLVANFDLVAIFWKTIFICGKTVDLVAIL